MTRETALAPLLEIEDVHQTLGGFKVLEGVSLRLERGVRHALIGPNGSGKSTLLNLIGGQLRLQRGQIRFNGRAIGAMSARERAAMGIARCFQMTQIFPHLTARENLVVANLRQHAAPGWALRPWQASRHLREQVAEQLARLRLRPVADDRAATLSYGHQRALELGLALAGAPQLLLLDEPTAGLSRAESAWFVDLIDTLSANATVLMIEHDLSIVDALAHSVSRLENGRLVGFE